MAGGSTVARGYQTALLLLLNVFLFADQNLMAPNLSQIAVDLGLTPAGRDRLLGGYVSLGFFTVGAVASFVGGYLADSHCRVLALAGVVVIGESACLATYFVQTPQQFVAVRTLTGVAIGANVPITFSLLGDLHHTATRGRITAFAGIAMGCGVGFGQVLAGLMGPTLGWRIPFIAIAVPAMLLAVVLVATTREPQRGAQEEVLEHYARDSEFHYGEVITWRKLAKLFRTPSVMLILAQGLPGSLPWGVVIVYFNDYIAQEMGIAVQKSTLLVLAFGVGIMLGQLFAGWLTDRWLRRRLLALVIFTSVSLVVGAVPMIAALFLRDIELWLYLVMCFPAGFLCGIPTGVLRGMLMNVTIPEVRGSAFAVFNLVDDLGRGLGPFFISLILAAFPPEQRNVALAISFSAWFVTAILIIPLACTYREDLARAEEQVVRAFLRKQPELEREEFLLLHSGATDNDDDDTVSFTEIEDISTDDDVELTLR